MRGMWDIFRDLLASQLVQGFSYIVAALWEVVFFGARKMVIPNCGFSPPSRIFLL